MTNIIVTGASGHLAPFLIARLKSLGYNPYPVFSKAYDLRNARHIDALFKHTGKPDIIFHLAARVGGIQYNIDNPATLFYDNVVMNTQLIHKAMLAGCGKFVMCGSVCSYPAFNPIPTPEHRLWEGYPETSNGPYGIAKLAALEQLQAYSRQHGMKYAYPVLSNLYGPGGSVDDYKSHVIPALIKRFLDKPDKIEIWGDGSPTRDFLYLDDAAEALTKFIDVDCEEPINIAGGIEISIRRVVELLTKITGYEGEIAYDSTKPNGQLRRAYTIHKARHDLAWQPETKFEDGLKRTVEYYANHHNDQR